MRSVEFPRGQVAAFNRQQNTKSAFHQRGLCVRLDRVRFHVRQFKRLALLVGSTVLLGANAGGEVEIGFEHVPNLPTCTNPFPVPRSRDDGTEVHEPAGGLYCVKADEERLAEDPELFSAIRAAAQDLVVTQAVFMSAHYVDSQMAADFVCALPGIGRATVELSGQAAFVAEPHVDRSVVNRLIQCSGHVVINLIGCDPFKPKNVWIKRSMPPAGRQRGRRASCPASPPHQAPHRSVRRLGARHSLGRGLRERQLLVGFTHCHHRGLGAAEEQRRGTS